MAFRVFFIGCLALVGVSCAHSEISSGYRSSEVRSVIGIRGKPLILHCPLKTYQTDSSVKWLLNNNPVNPEDDRDNRYLFDNGTLIIRKIQGKNVEHGSSSDTGEYRCLVVTSDGVITSAPISVKFAHIAHSFNEHPTSLTVYQGDIVRLHCDIHSSPPAEISWEKDDKPLPQDNVKIVHSQSGSILYILNSVPENSGSYRCIAVNSLAKKIRHSAIGTVVVNAPTSGRYPNNFLSPANIRSELKVFEGNNVTIDCALRQVSPLSWAFNTSGLMTPKKESLSGLNILELANASKKDAGDYICSAMNSSIVPRTVHLVVQTKPIFLETPVSQSFYAARTIRLRCVVSGEPTPTVQWFKEGVPIIINGRIKHKISINETLKARTSELVLSSSVAQDSGLYQCVALNDVGTVWATGKLYMNTSKAPPSAPSQVTCETISATQVMVKWNIESPRPDIKAFSIHYSLTDGGEERQQVSSHANRSSIIDKLQPFSNYTFSVRVYTDSASDFSNRVTCLTGEDVPIAAPEINLESTGPDTLRVFWKLMPYNLSQGLITEYKIQWKRASYNPSYKVDQVSNSVFNYTIAGLAPSEEYEIRVLAATNKGWPNLPLPWQTFTMPSIDQSLWVPTAPLIHLQAINASSIKATWELLDVEHVVGYKIFIRPQNGPLMGPTILSPHTNQYLFVNLETDTQYEVLLRAFTSNSVGFTAIQMAHTLAKGLDDAVVLEPPIGLEAEPKSANSVLVKWMRPQALSPHKNHVLYEVCYTIMGSSDEKGGCFNSSENSLLVKNLRPFTWYEFKVMVRDKSRGMSRYSQPVECPTLESVPSAVQSIHWKSLNQSTILVIWQEPHALNGVLRNYTISYTEDGSQPLADWKHVTVPSNKYSIEVSNLKRHTKYTITVRASTGAGYGPTGPLTECVIDSRFSDLLDQPNNGQFFSFGQNFGFAIGLTISILLCIVMCTVILVFRRSCVKVVSGGQLSSPSESSRNIRNAELEMLSRDRDAPSASHVDAKGGYSSSNGIIPDFRNSTSVIGRLPNGSSKLSAIHIVDNPRYDPNSSESPILGLHAKSSSRLHESTSSGRSHSGTLCNDSNLPLLNESQLAKEADNERSVVQIRNGFYVTTTEGSRDAFDGLTSNTMTIQQTLA